MKYILFSFLLLNMIVCNAQVSPADEVIYKGIKQMKRAKSATDYIEIYQNIDKFADTTKFNWLLHYYSAFARVLQFTDNTTKRVVGHDSLLFQAESHLQKALKIQKDEEVLILQAYIKILRIQSNPKKEYPIYSDELDTMFGEIRSITGNNPRQSLVEALLVFYTPEGISGGKDAARGPLMQSLDIFRAGEEMKYMFMPTWGQLIVEDHLKKLD